MTCCLQCPASECPQAVLGFKGHPCLKCVRPVAVRLIDFPFGTPNFQVLAPRQRNWAGWNWTVTGHASFISGRQSNLATGSRETWQIYNVRSNRASSSPVGGGLSLSLIEDLSFSGTQLYDLHSFLMFRLRLYIQSVCCLQLFTHFRIFGAFWVCLLRPLN